MDSKKCPVCKEIKKADQFYAYFSKVRNTKRLSNYCKPCARIKGNARMKKYYQEHKESRLEYSKEYRKSNPEKIKAKRKKFKKKYRDELHRSYVAEMASKSLKVTTKEIYDNPDLLEAYRANLLLKRKINAKK